MEFEVLRMSSAPHIPPRGYSANESQEFTTLPGGDEVQKSLKVRWRIRTILTITAYSGAEWQHPPKTSAWYTAGTV
jgi:hypothetical protein